MKNQLEAILTEQYVAIDLVDGKRSFKINFSTKTATKKETFLRLDFITTNPVVLLRL